MDIQGLVRDASQADVLHQRLATACYPEHGLPMLLYLAMKHDHDLEAALLANANAGGDNVHRSMVLGLVVGAASETVPDHLKTGLADYPALSAEIDAFTEVATAGRGV
jgi:hypothetical protein